MLRVQAQGNKKSVVNVFVNKNNNNLNVSNNSVEYYNSLSKNWACKYPESVDGKEFSSKYYAELSRVKATEVDSVKRQIFENESFILVADDLKTGNKIKDCANNINVIQNASTNAKKAQEQALISIEQANIAIEKASIATNKKEEIIELSNNFLNKDLDNLSEQGKKVLKQNTDSALPVGTIFSHTASATFVPENSLPCDGAEYSQIQFKTLYDDWLVNGHLETCSYEEYQQDVTVNGACARFGVDTVTGMFKVPLIPDGYYIRKGRGTANKAGLPDHIHKYRMVQRQAYYPGNQNNAYHATSEDFATGGSNTSKASASNPIYGASDTVETNAVAYRYFVVVATESIKQSEMDWARYMDGLQGKLNKDMSNLPVTNDIVIDYKVNSDGSWYRQYKSGWLEQGGIIPSFADNWTLTFPKPFKDSNYMLQGEQWGTDAGGNLGINEQKRTFAKGNHVGGGNIKVSWYACGQGA